MHRSGLERPRGYPGPGPRRLAWPRPDRPPL